MQSYSNQGSDFTVILSQLFASLSIVTTFFFFKPCTNGSFSSISSRVVAAGENPTENTYTPLTRIKTLESFNLTGNPGLLAVTLTLLREIYL